MLRTDRMGLRKTRGLLVLVFLGSLLCHGCATRDDQGPAGVLFVGAQEALQAGRFNRAEMLLERAMRVEPRKAENWQLMGQVRFGQRQYAQAVQFCLKSNSLAGKNVALIEQNWRLIEKSYTQMGEPKKAARVRRKYLRRP